VPAREFFLENYKSVKLAHTPPSSAVIPVQPPSAWLLSTSWNNERKMGLYKFFCGNMSTSLQHSTACF
jgi:hypothetical protein